MDLKTYLFLSRNKRKKFKIDNYELKTFLVDNGWVEIALPKKLINEHLDSSNLANYERKFKLTSSGYEALTNFKHESYIGIISFTTLVITIIQLFK